MSFVGGEVIKMVYKNCGTCKHNSSYVMDYPCNNCKYNEDLLEDNYESDLNENRKE